MRAIQIKTIGEPEVLTMADLPIPEPGTGEIRIRVEAAGVNFIEIYQRSGAYQRPLPFVPGGECAGVVDAVGAGVTGFNVGDRVATAQASAAYAEYTLAPADQVVPVPDGVELQTAAAVMLQGITAHYLSHSTFPIKVGDRVLIHAAAGGVGLLLCQMAKHAGAYVIGTVSTEEKERRAREAGADAIIRYTEQDFVTETRRLTDGKGVDVVYDSVGKTTFDGSLDVLRPRGYLVLFGQSSGAVAPVNPQILNAKGSLFLTRPTMAHYIADRAELLMRTADLFGWIATGELKVRIDRAYSLAEAPAAHRALAARETSGKVLLLP